MINNKIIDLDECVLNALDLFQKEKLPNVNIKFKKPLIVGSGNAAVTGKIIFSDKDAVFADESNYKDKIENNRVDGAVIISASGGKHAPLIAKYLKIKKIKTVLMTNNPNALASKYSDKTHVFPKNPEPYTYNTSTYLGMILSKTKENPKKIKEALRKIDKFSKKLKNYDSYFIIVPEEFDYTREMFLTKFDELFGPKISGRVFTYEQTKHAKTLVPSDKELFVGLGVNNKIFGKNRVNIPFKGKEAGLIATGYYFIGKIQKQNPDYFKKNIESYVKFASRVFNQEIKIIS